MPAGTGSKGLDPSLASGSNPPFSTVFGRQSRESAPFPKPKAGVALPSRRDKGLFCPGTIFPLTSSAPSQRSLGTAPQSCLSAALWGTSASKFKAEVIFPLPSVIEAPPRALWRRGESFPRKLQGGGWSPAWAEGRRGSSLAPPACPLCPHCILNGFLSMFWDGSHKSGARNQGWWGLSPLHLCGAAPGSVPALYRAGFPKVDVSQGCPRLVGAPGSAGPAPGGAGSCEWAAINRHNRRANAAAPAAAAAPRRK